MHTPGFFQILLILAIVVLLFGGKKLPELGGAVGEAIKNFKKATRNDNEHAPSSTAQETQPPKMEQPKALPQATAQAPAGSGQEQTHGQI